jgi:hypothetical protein
MFSCTLHNVRRDTLGLFWEIRFHRRRPKPATEPLKFRDNRFIFISMLDFLHGPRIAQFVRKRYYLAMISMRVLRIASGSKNNGI